MYRVYNENQNTIVATQITRASAILERMVGLLGRKSLPSGHGLWIEPCNSVQTFFMKFPIDIVFMSKSNEVVRIYKNLKPFRVTPIIFNARSVLELPGGSLDQVSIRNGDRLKLEEIG